MRPFRSTLAVLAIAAAALVLAIQVRLPAAIAAGDHSAAWPATRAGLLAHAWADSFSAGERAMRAFAAEHIARAALAKKGLDARMASYRDLHDRLGELTLDAVVRADSGALVVKLLDANAAPHEFTFTLEPHAPWQLVSVTMLDHEMRAHPGLGWLHH